MYEIILIAICRLRHLLLKHCWQTIIFYCLTPQLPALQFRGSQFAHRCCSSEFCSQVRSCLITTVSLSAIFMFICETNSQLHPRRSQQVQTRWLPGWLAIFPVCCLPRLGAFTKEFGGDGGGLVLMAAMVWGGIRFRCLLFLSIL